MKKRLHDKKAGIAILIAIIMVSLAEMIFRAVVLREAALTTANVGEQVAVLLLAITILIMTAKGKDRICYLCYGAWIAYFVLDQLFELPGMIVSMITILISPEIAIITPGLGILAYVLKVLSSLGIIALGVLLVEYTNDGTIYNRIFNGISIVTLVLLLVMLVYSLICAITSDPTFWNAAFYNMYRLTMIFLFTFFAYDSAKMQLKKVNFSK